MARKAGQIIARGKRTWLVRVYTGRVPETQKRAYLNKTIHGIRRDAQEYLNHALVERDRRRSIIPTKVTVLEYCKRWLATAVKPRVRLSTPCRPGGRTRRWQCQRWRAVARDHHGPAAPSSSAPGGQLSSTLA